MTPKPFSSIREIYLVPLLNADLGEALLFSGTARESVQKYIIAQGFDLLFPKPYNQSDVDARGVQPRYQFTARATGDRLG